MGTTRLDLAAIEASLRGVQHDFDRINATLAVPRDPLSSEVVEYLMSAYAYADALLAQGVDPVAMGSSGHLLRLNTLVLHGTEEENYRTCERHLKETERHFYDDRSPGGVRALMGYMAEHKGESVWRRAAGAYIHALSQPQLFIEGNHRTGALIMSLILAREGKPPFVLTVENAKAYFDPSSLMKESKKHSLKSLIAVPKLKKRLAGLLKDTADERFLAQDAPPKVRKAVGSV